MCAVYLICGKTLTFPYVFRLFLVDKTGQMGTKRDKWGQNRTFGYIWVQMGTSETLPLDSHKKPPISLGILSQFKFLFYGKVK